MQRLDVVVLGRGGFRLVVPDQGVDLPAPADLHENRGASDFAGRGADGDDQPVVGRVDGEGDALDGDGFGCWKGNRKGL